MEVVTPNGKLYSKQLLFMGLITWFIKYLSRYQSGRVYTFLDIQWTIGDHSFCLCLTYNFKLTIVRSSTVKLYITLRRNIS